MDVNRNPRGLKRPHDGRGNGLGVEGGLRQGQNPTPCSDVVLRGFGRGKGRFREK